MKEEWRDVVGYEGLYQVSNLGRVKSLRRVAERTHRPTTVNEKILKTSEIRGGHLRVCLSKDWKSKKLLVHRLVAEAFIENNFNYPIINHKNGNPKDNRPSNLEWCDYQHNNNHRYLNMHKHKGFTIHKRDKTGKPIKFRATMSVYKIFIDIGVFDCPHKARDNYRAAHKEWWGVDPEMEKWSDEWLK